jgi:spermidine synthase
VNRRPAAALAAAGLVSMLGQVALLRELAVASFGIELVFLAGTACWLAAGAAGALVPPPRAPWTGVRAGLAALALVLPLELAFLRGARVIFGGVPGAYLPLGQELATAALGLMPAGALLGWLFRCGARAMAGAGRSLSAAYAWESLGGALGCAAATASFTVGASNLSLTLAGGLAAAAAAAALGPVRRLPTALAAAALCALATLASAAPAVDRWTTGWSHPGLALVRDTPYGRVAAAFAQGQLTVFEDDALAWDSEGTEAEALVHPAALQVAPGARVLILEGGLYGVAAEALKHRPARLDVVALDGARVQALAPHLPPEGRAALADPAVHLTVADPRAFVAAATGTWDLVLIGAGEPSSGQANRLFTEELFRRCAARLAPGGVLALRLPSLENRWTPGLTRRNAAVHAALRAAFEDVLVLPGTTDVLLASRSPLVRDPAVLGERLRARGIAAREITPEALRWLLTNDRVETSARLLAAAGAEPNRDDRPVCYQQTALLWLGKLLGGPQDARLPGRCAVLAVLAALAALTAAARFTPRARAWALVAAASFAAMSLESMALLRYQASSGALYRDLGLLLTAFMLGLAGGGWGFARAAGDAAPTPRAWGVAPLLLLALLALGFATMARAGLAFGLGPASALLLAAGAALAAIFGFASRMGPEPGLGPSGDGGPAGPLYAADLLGGCLGSLLAGLLLVVVLGMAGTAAAAGGLAAVALLLAW